MKIPHPELAHATSLGEAEALQKQIRDRVELAPLPRQPHRVAGCDVAYARDGVLGFSAVVVLDVETLIKIEHETGRALCPFPYVPGLFAFREIPILLRALQNLSEPPDVILVEGHGIAHPRRAGLASHLGVLLEIPSIGCAKTPLGGTWQEPPDRPGAWSEVRYEGEVVGAAYRSRAGSQPLFLSPGHRVDLASIVDLMPKLLRDQRLPEPLAQAHEAAVKTRARHAKTHPRP